jgi:hypothetical protein
MFLRAVGGLLGCVLLMVGAPASAWTSAQVQDVRARVVLSARGQANVLLDLGIDVRGGWLERFDIEGLSPELVLDPDRPGWLTTAEGSVVSARVISHQGNVSVRFDKREAARRGQHRLSIAYRAPLTALSDSGALSFTVPGFQQAIGEAEIVVDAPLGVKPVSDPESTTEVSERVQGQRVHISFRRTHWPRAIPWTVELDVNSAADAPQAVRAARVRSVYTGCALSLFVGAIGLLARGSFRRRARALGMRTEPWLGPDWLQPWLIGTLAVLGAVLWPHSVELSLGAWLSLSAWCAERALPSSEAPSLSTIASLDAARKRKLVRAYWRELLGELPWSDGFTLLGALGVIAVCLVSAGFLGGRPDASDPWRLGLLCALPSWIASSRLRLSRSPAERLRRLLAETARLRLDGCALRLVSYVGAGHALVETRARLLPATRYAGLVRVDLCVDSRRDVQTPWIVVVVRRGAPVDHFLEHYFSPAERSLSSGGLRAAYVRAAHDPNAFLEDLFAHLSHESQALLQKRETKACAA